MRAFLERFPSIEFIEIILDNEEVSTLSERGIFKEFLCRSENGEKSKIYNIFIGVEDNPKINAVNQGLEIDTYF